MSANSEYRAVNIARIRISGGTQPRAAISQDVVDEYGVAMRSGAHFPPVVVFQSGTDYWLADGFHRYYAAQESKVTHLDAEVRQGTQRDAILYSVGANSEHGLRRTNEDKRRAVMTLLQDAEWAAWADNAIAKQCRVSNHLVAEVRAHLGEFQDMRKTHLATFQDASDASRTCSRNGTEYQVQTANIGRRVPSETDLDYERMKRTTTTHTVKTETTEPAGGDHTQPSSDDTLPPVAQTAAEPVSETISKLCNVLKTCNVQRHSQAEIETLHEAVLDLNDRIESRLYAAAK